VVSVNRLVYRKGIDLMVGVIPRICQAFPTVDFVIGGGGPKLVALEEMVETHALGERVELLGHVRHADVPNVGGGGGFLLYGFIYSESFLVYYSLPPSPRSIFLFFIFIFLYFFFIFSLFFFIFSLFFLY
jgi:glycosyltransferase involved in cell wall biosynthesis